MGGRKCVTSQRQNPRRPPPGRTLGELTEALPAPDAACWRPSRRPVRPVALGLRYQRAPRQSLRTPIRKMSAAHLANYQIPAGVLVIKCSFLLITGNPSKKTWP